MSNKKKSKKKLTLADYYKKYLYKHPPRDKHFIDNKIKWTSILKRFFELVSDEIINNGMVYRMPHGVGSLYIVKFVPSKRRAINFYETHKLYGEYNKDKPKGEKKLVYHTNRHSYGYAGRFFWKKAHLALKNKSLYMFKPVKRNRLLLSDCIKNRNTILKYVSN